LTYPSKNLDFNSVLDVDSVTFLVQLPT
jgi:hypothetical protein